MIFLLAFILGLFSDEVIFPGPKRSEDGLSKVTRVIDGDTIELESGQRVRYIGLNAPESVDPRKPVQCFGQEAVKKNKELVEGKKVRLEKDVSETDKYRRLLRYVYLEDTFINDYLIRQGYAYASSYPPDVKYQERFKEAEEEARQITEACGGTVGPKKTALLPYPQF